MDEVVDRYECPECNEDLTSLFKLKMVVTCNECNTKCKLETVNKQIAVITLEPKKSSKPLRRGEELDEIFSVQLTEDQATLFKKFLPKEHNANEAQCMVCGDIISMFFSFLVRMSTNIFPKKVDIIDTFSPAGNPVKERVITYMPPVKQEGRLCKKCFDNNTSELELIPDKFNMMRDGIRNVRVSPSGKGFRYERDMMPKELNFDHLMDDEDILVGFDQDPIEVTEKKRLENAPRMSFTNKIDDDLKTFQVRLRPYKPKPQLIKVSPSKKTAFRPGYRKSHEEDLLGSDFKLSKFRNLNMFQERNK